MTDAQTTVTDSVEIPVVDTTPPEITVEGDQAFSSCENGENWIQLVLPTVEDVCSVGDLELQGQVMESSNAGLELPVEVDWEGNVLLPVGVHTIVWTAIDDAGNPSSVEEQVIVRPALHATHSFVVRENGSQVLLTDGSYASIANSGSGWGAETDIRNDSGVGDILSVPVVKLGHRSHAGDIVSQTPVQWDANVSANDWPTIGDETIGPVELQDPFDLAGVSFPNGGGWTYVNGTQSSWALGDYGHVIVNSGGRLVLESGDYFFEELTMYSQGEVEVQEDTRIYAGHSQQLQGAFVDAGGDMANVTLGYGGSLLQIWQDFRGIIVAPSATVKMDTSNATSLRGMIHARSIYLENGADFTCEVP